MAKIIGRGAPTAATFGILGQEYIDWLTGTRYVCTKSTHKTGTRVGEADQHCEWVPEGSDNPGGTGGVSSWNDLTDKPFGEVSESITWDGNTNGLVMSGASPAYLISNRYVAPEDYIGAAVVLSNGVTHVITEENLNPPRPGSMNEKAGFFSIVIPNKEIYGDAIVSSRDDMIDPAGIYFYNDGVKYISEVIFPPRVKTLDEKYIPDTIPRGLSIKEIEFTDRPTLYAWLQSNMGKFIKGVYKNNLMDVPMVVTQISAHTLNGSPVYDLFELAPATSVNLDGTIDYVFFFVLMFSVLNNQVEAFESKTEEGSESEIMVLPDELWSQAGAHVKIYYVE